MMRITTYLSVLTLVLLTGCTGMSPREYQFFVVNELNEVNRVMEDQEFRFYNAQADSMNLGYSNCEEAVLHCLDTLKKVPPCNGCEELQKAALVLTTYYKDDVLVDLHKILDLTTGPRPDNPFPVIHGLLMASYEGEEQHVARFEAAHRAFAEQHGIEILQPVEEEE